MAETTKRPERNIQRQQYLVEKRQIAYEQSPSDETKLKLDREMDFLRHLINAEKGNVKNRAKEKAESAKRALLDRAIKQIPPE